MDPHYGTTELENIRDYNNVLNYRYDPPDPEDYEDFLRQQQREAWGRGKTRSDSIGPVPSNPHRAQRLRNTIAKCMSHEGSRGSLNSAFTPHTKGKWPPKCIHSNFAPDFGWAWAPHSLRTGRIEGSRASISISARASRLCRRLNDEHWVGQAAPSVGCPGER